jgi:hypothetical protein
MRLLNPQARETQTRPLQGSDAQQQARDGSV